MVVLLHKFNFIFNFIKILKRAVILLTKGWIVMRRCVRRRCGWRGRLPVNVRSELNLGELVYLPVKAVSSELSDYIEVYDYEVEALKLVHLDGLSTDEASVRMGISKATFWRILESCRMKLAQALISGKPIKLVSTFKIDTNKK